MKNLFISHDTALKIYKKYRAGHYCFYLTDARTSDFKKSCVDSTLLYTAIDELHLDDKIHIMVSSRKANHKNKHSLQHNCASKLPKNAFKKIKENIYIVSPEFLFCQIAAQLSKQALFMIGLELCGTYNILNEDKYMYDAKPITSAKKILHFCKTFRKNQHNFKGIRKACKIAELLQDNSASPKESVLYAMLRAPRRWGGFNVKNLVMNEKIDLSEEAKIICNQNYMKADIKIKNKKIAIEYDSDQFHSSIEQQRIDKNRMNAYLKDKWKVVTFLSPYLKDIKQFSILARDILKYNLQSANIRGKNFLDKAAEFLSALNKCYV